MDLVIPGLVLILAVVNFVLLVGETRRLKNDLDHTHLVAHEALHEAKRAHSLLIAHIAGDEIHIMRRRTNDKEEP